MYKPGLFRVFRARLRAHTVLALLAVSTQLALANFASVMPAMAAVGLHMGRNGAVACSSPPAGSPVAPPACAQAMNQAAPAADPLRLALPAGARPCPASGPGASCNAADSVPQPAPGVASLPAGTSACPVRLDKPAPDAPAACDATLLPVPGPAVLPVADATPPAPRVTPSIPVWTLSAADPQPRIQLAASVSALKPNQQTILTATTSTTVTGTSSAIEIFDQTANILIGACAEGSRCQVAYAAGSGVHSFAAYLTPAIAGPPTDSVLASNAVRVAWFAVSLATSAPAVVGPGKPVTFTATATADVNDTGFQLGLYDQTTGQRLTFCSRGTVCSTTLTMDKVGARAIVAYVAAAAQSPPPLSIQAQSAAIKATWLGVTLDANTTHPQLGANVFMRATANVDVTNTPWSIGIYDQKGDLVGDACKSGTTCTARVTLTTGATPSFTAVVGAVRPLTDGGSSMLVQLVRTAQVHASLVNIQARSNPVRPTRLLWGVDSCKPLTGDPTDASGLLAQVNRYYGSPDFWGRYLTRTYNCPGISANEIALATFRHMGILPIYNDYDCSAVRGYSTGLRYATAAGVVAANLGIPAGTVLAIDIEPPGDYCPGAANVDAGFVEGWYDGITLAGYAPLYYGNGTAGSEFGSAWCTAVSARPEVASSYLWSFEPSLMGRFTRAKAPEYSPKQPGCTANLAAWQYMLSSGSRPDVDSDEAISSLPLWFPGT